MSVVIEGSYLGDKKIELLHVDSGSRIRTVAPKDNNGDGSLFSPTDLFSASLGACMMTIMGIVADRDGLDLAGSHFRVEKHMSTTTPRKVAKITVGMHLPSHLPEETRVKLQRAGHTCPVHHSIHPEVELDIAYHFDV